MTIQKPIHCKTHLENDKTIKPGQVGRPEKFPKMLCKIFKVEIAHYKWSDHLRSKTHIENGPDQTIKPHKNGRPIIFNKPTKLCEKCNVEITRSNWTTHLKSKTHLKNDPDQTFKPPNKPGKHIISGTSTMWCEICNTEITLKAGNAHLRRKKNL